MNAWPGQLASVISPDAMQRLNIARRFDERSQRRLRFCLECWAEKSGSHDHRSYLQTRSDTDTKLLIESASRVGCDKNKHRHLQNSKNRKESDKK